MRLNRRIGILAAAGILTALPACGQWEANTKLCFPNVVWFGGGPPAMGADINDPGWRGATVYRFDNMTGTPDVPVQMMGIFDASNLYLRFIVSRNGAMNSNDAVVVMFDNGDGNQRRRLIIFPSLGGVDHTAGAVAPNSISYNKGTNFNGTGAGYTAVPAGTGSQFGNAGAGAPPAGVDVKLAISNDGGVTPVVTYIMDVKIPYVSQADPFPLSVSPFGVYVDVIRILSDLSANSTSFPSNTPIGDFYTDTPAFSGFATGSLGGACKGVSFDATDISANNDPLSLTTDNTFAVTLHNNTVNAAGTAVLAPQVQATFKICDFGMGAPGSCKVVPAANNPATPQDIPASSSSSCPGPPCFQTGGWHPKPGDPADMNTAYFTANPHQCILVELTGTPPSTTGPCAAAARPPECNSVLFANNAALHNMNFPSPLGSGLHFQGFIAKIDLQPYQLVAGRNFQQLEMHVAARPFASAILINNNNREFNARAAGPNNDNLLWTVHGYRYNGRFITVKDKKYELTDHLGSFGYSVHYGGTQAAKWRYQFFGERGDKVDGGTNGVYMMRVEGKAGYVSNGIEGDDQAPVAVPQEPNPPSGPGSGPGPQPGGNNNWIWIVLGILVVLIVLYLVLRKK